MCHCHCHCHSSCSKACDTQDARLTVAARVRGVVHAVILPSALATSAIAHPQVQTCGITPSSLFSSVSRKDEVVVQDVVRQRKFESDGGYGRHEQVPQRESERQDLTHQARDFLGRFDDRRLWHGFQFLERAQWCRYRQLPT